MDHHCFYVNNCVGKKNYRLYIASLATISLLFVSNFIVAIISIASWYSDPDYRRAEETVLQTTSEIAVQTFNGVVALVGFLVGGYGLNLLGLHCVLYYKGMTTLEYARWLQEAPNEPSREARERCRPFSYMYRKKRTPVHPDNQNTTIDIGDGQPS
ncbi:uncharacterized protein BJ171DRAFT_127337 [Polychytrium aggregatum]|uniref:uncharacterized protein n=1 Tax=Polychytrium aggregatum TaxID=110093 RepID=UPI0022FF0637|nr:uncharacterized protein BJ171DRAFT_127337 [Polychytrium aggregatum]KAI9204008.1 hypothetical protein BJ171DRAFT_127337 [Polychytrium aggregatum]